ncbi:MAG: S8 family serine peptidase [Geminicoccaceae bacterium]
MVQTGERVVAVITSQSVDADKITKIPASNAPAGDDVADMLENARFIAQVLVAEGFELLNFHPLAISFGGSPAAFERFFGFHPVRRAFPGGRGRRIDGFDVEPQDADRLSALPAAFEGRAGFMAIARPPKLIDDASAPMRDVGADLPIWSLPDELALSIWANGVDGPVGTGHGVVVAQIGTGHYRHRFFSDRGYRVLPTLLGPGQCHPQRDDHGHGTGEAACLFGAAPDLRLRPIKGLLDPVGDLLMTIDSAPGPDLIVGSWGYDVDQGGWDELAANDRNLHHYLKLLELAIAFACTRGVVVCAAAPTTWRSFPACHPDVISIGAISSGRAAQQMRAEAGVSGLYPGRRVPDIWSDAAKSVRAGLDLVGCTHPAQPGSALAWTGLQEAGADEGFAWCEIEQAASPLAASKLALLLEQHRGMSPAAFKAMVVATNDLATADDAGSTRLGQAANERALQASDPLYQFAGETDHAACGEHPGMGSLAG